MIENAYIHFFERKRITGSDIISWSPPPQRFGDKLQRVKKWCRHYFVFFKTNVWFYVTWSLVALSLVVTRTFQLELERFCTLAWLFWGYCICSNQFLHHSACLQFSSLALVLSYGITGALKVFFSSREQTTPILLLLYEHWGFQSFCISLSLPQKQRSFSKHREGCRPASLLGESSEKDPWDFQSLSFLLSSGGLWRDDFGFFPFRLVLNSISSPPNDFSICISNGWVLMLPAPRSSSGYWDSSTGNSSDFSFPSLL